LAIFTDRPQDTLNFRVFHLRQFLFETATFLLAEMIHPFTVILGNMKTIYHYLKGNFRMRFVEFCHRIGIPFPHICTNFFYRLPQTRGNTLKKPPYGFLLTVCQDAQERHMSVCLLGSQDGYKIAVPFGHCNFINADDLQLGELVPIHAGLDTTVNRSRHRVIAYIFFASDVFYGAIDQLQHQVAVICFRVRTLGIIPIQLLCARLAITVRTFIALRAQANVQPMSQNGQMSQFNLPSATIGLRDLTTTRVADGAITRAFNCDNIIATFVDFYTDYFHFRNIQWKCN